MTVEVLMRVNKDGLVAVMLLWMCPGFGLVIVNHDN